MSYKLLGLNPEDKRIVLDELPYGALAVYTRLDQSKPVHIACRSESGKKYSSSSSLRVPFVAEDLRIDMITLGDQVLFPIYDVYVKAIKEIVQGFLDQFPDEKVYISFRPFNSDFDDVEIAFGSCEGKLEL